MILVWMIYATLIIPTVILYVMPILDKGGLSKDWRFIYEVVYAVNFLRDLLIVGVLVFVSKLNQVLSHCCKQNDEETQILLK